MDDQIPQKVIRAAGGLLWHPARGVYEIAMVHRPRYNDWSLPKGKLMKGETWQQAALREVVEETGWQAELGEFAGAIAYMLPKGVKVVRFWHMLAVRQTGSPVGREVSEVSWLTIEEARHKVQYPLELALLELWDGPGELV